MLISMENIVIYYMPHHQFPKAFSEPAMVYLWFEVSLTLYVRVWWRHQMETFSALLAICAGNSPVAGEILAQSPVTRSFAVFFDLRPNKRLSKHSLGWRDLRRQYAHYDVTVMVVALTMVIPWWHHDMEVFYTVQLWSITGSFGNLFAVSCWTNSLSPRWSDKPCGLVHACVVTADDKPCGHVVW